MVMSFDSGSEEDETNSFGIIQEQPFFAAGAFGLLTPSQALSDKTEEVVRPRKDRGLSLDNLDRTRTDSVIS